MYTWARAARAIAAAVVVLLPALAVRAEQANLGPSRDNTLYSSSSGTRSNGAGDHFFAGVTAQGGIRRGLIAFDVSSIPASATINGVVLRLHMSRTIAPVEPIEVHRVLADWGEGASNANAEEGRGATAQPGDATWLHRFYNTAFWSAAGGDYIALASATTPVAQEDFYTWSSPQLTADVQSWVNVSLPNFGWLILGEESIQATAKRFDTKENPVVEYRPVLMIDYTIVPEPAWTAVVLMTGIILPRRRFSWR